MDDLVTFLKVAMFIFIIAAIIVGLSVGAVAFVEKAKCRELGRLSDDNVYKWNLWLGCMVQLPHGAWVDADGLPVR